MRDSLLTMKLSQFAAVLRSALISALPLRNSWPSVGRRIEAQRVKVSMKSIISRRRLLAALGTLALPISPGSAAATAAAEAYIQGIGDNVLKLANAGSRGVALRNKFSSLLEKYVDLRAITLASLGPYRAQLPASDKGKLQDLVTLYASALFAWYVDDFKGQKFTVARSAPQGKFIVVYSNIEKAGMKADEPIVWYLQQSGDRFNVVDMSVLGVRLSIAMRDRFQKELKKSKGDFEQLYAVLREAETW